MPKPLLRFVLNEDGTGSPDPCPHHDLPLVCGECGVEVKYFGPDTWTHGYDCHERITSNRPAHRVDGVLVECGL
jgi:hypothetical protein